MSQTRRLLNLLLDGEPHRTDHILEEIYGGGHLGIARIGARVHDLKKQGYEIEGFRDEENPSLYWYQLVKNPTYVVAESRPCEKLLDHAAPVDLFSFKTDPLGRKVAV